jgi:hypothetical protein
MSSHGTSVPEQAGSAGKVTTFMEKDARRRAGLRDSQPILGALCPDAQARLFDFSVERRDRRPVTRDGLQLASETVLTCVQGEYHACTSPLEPTAAIELASARLWAIHACGI